jgi:hypothetical protein
LLDIPKYYRCLGRGDGSLVDLKQKKPFIYMKSFGFVGVARFELTASTSQTWRDTGLRYTPLCAFSKFESANIQLF